MGQRGVKVAGVGVVQHPGHVDLSIADATGRVQVHIETPTLGRSEATLLGQVGVVAGDRLTHQPIQRSGPDLVRRGRNMLIHEPRCCG